MMRLSVSKMGPGLAAVLVAAAVCGAAGAARAQSVSLQIDSRELYAGLPFVLSVAADGFDEDPAPSAPELAIAGCKVTPLGMNPNISTSIQIINGRRSESRRVTFVYQYRVEAAQPGTYEIPALAVSQGGKRASSRPASFRVQEIATSRDMQIRLSIPDRPLWVGETFEAVVDWYLRRDVDDQNFVVPLFDLEDWVDVSGPDAERGKALAFSAGARTLDLPFERSAERLDGAEYTRFRFRALVTPIRAGTVDLAPARVMAKLQVGYGRDAFGFRVPRMGFFKAEDRQRQLQVKPLPLKDRPASFHNAVGTAFSVQVQANRTVVRVGDPVELRILIRGDGLLHGLGLPALDGEGGLAPELFSVADEPATGEILDDKNGKLFRVTVRLKSPEAREIPALPFSYFNPEDGRYHTVHSDPVALSVKGSAVVGAGDVVSADPGTTARPAKAGGEQPGPVSLVGADLSLSDQRKTMRAVWSIGDVAPVLYALYGLPLLVFGLRSWQVRTRGERSQDSALKQALSRVERQLEAAAHAPAPEAAPRLASALRELGRLAGSPPPAEILERLEVQAYDPANADQPLTEPLRRQVGESARELANISGRPGRTPRRPGPGPSATALVVLFGLFGGLGGDRAAAAGDAHDQLERARTTYQGALAEPAREARTAGFARAEAEFRALVVAHPDRPELLTDWGNAALGAYDLGWAALAYRRALRLDSSLARARRNLHWVRERGPSWLPRPASQPVSESLFFWHHVLSVPERHLLGAGGFALAMLLAAPWLAGRRRRQMRAVAAVFALVFAAMLGSVALERDDRTDAVLVADGVTMRAADSAGAPAALTSLLPAGAELQILEIRDRWARVAVPGGTSGWVPAATLQRVADGPQV
jgi:hypothetical protein